jgi:hypothetical protein
MNNGTELNLRGRMRSRTPGVALAAAAFVAM